MTHACTFFKKTITKVFGHAYLETDELQEVSGAVLDERHAAKLFSVLPRTAARLVQTSHRARDNLWRAFENPQKKQLFFKGQTHRQTTNENTPVRRRRS